MSANPKHFENDFKTLLMMIQTMVLWIDNDYEDEDLKERAKEVHKYLERLDYLYNMEKSPMDDVIKKLDNIEKLLEKLVSRPAPQLPFIPPRVENYGCFHSRMVPSHMVISQPTKFTCPDCGETVTIGPNVI